MMEGGITESLSVPSICLLVIVVALLIYFLQGGNQQNAPPRPFSWPLLGNLPQISGGDGFYANILKLRERHGDIFSLDMGEMSTVVVFGYKNVAEVLVEKGDIFKNRPNWLYIPSNVIKKRGIFWTNGEVWEKLTHLLKASQEEKTIQATLETEILAEVDKTCEDIEKQDGRPFDVQSMISRSVINIISAGTLGKRFDHSDEEFKTIAENINYVMDNSKTSSPVNVFPFLAFIFGSKFQTVMDKEEEVFEIFRKKIEEHRSTLDKQRIRDYIDMYLCLDSQEQLHEAYSEKNFLRSMVDCYLGGYDTTTSMLLWSLTYFIRYKDIQEKCQQEMDKVVGRDEKVRMDDMNNLPFTSAAIKEMRRVAGSIVVTALRTNTTDTTIGPYTIPKDSIVICDLRQHHIDGKIWDDPTEFKPERFMEENNKPYQPFGFGPRICTAQKMAETLLFLYVANLLHRYTLTSGDSGTITLDSFFTGVSLRPKPSNISFVQRT